MAVVTSSLVSALRVGFQREFQDALSSAPSQWDRLSTRVPSSSAGNTYGWIGQFPKLREWSGDRSFKNIKEHGYSVMNNLYEATVDIPRTAVEDDDIGVYAPLFREMGYAAGTHPDEIVFGLLKNGMSGTCYDGKAFFARGSSRVPERGRLRRRRNRLQLGCVPPLWTERSPTGRRGSCWMSPARCARSSFRSAPPRNCRSSPIRTTTMSL